VSDSTIQERYQILVMWKNNRRKPVFRSCQRT